MESILTSIKKLLGISDDDESFDSDIIMHINTVLMVLSQIGVGSTKCFSIVDKTAKWTDFLADINQLPAVKTYVYIKVKMVFDPPTTSALYDALKQEKEELEWRLNISSEYLESEVSNG